MGVCAECGATEASGCQCSASDGDCIDIEGSGTASNPFVAVPIIDPDTANLAECNPSGFGAFLPAELADPPAVRVTHSTNQSIAHNVSTILAFNTERYDTDSMHDITTNNSRITFNTAGVYIVTAQVQWEANASNDRKLQIRLNAATFLTSQETSPDQASDPFDMEVTTHYKFAVGDYVEVIVTQGSGVSLLIVKDPATSPEFMAARVAVG